MLKTIGGGAGIGALGLAQSVGAVQENQINESVVSRIKSTEIVQQLLGDLEDVELSPDRASQTLIGDDSQVSVTEFETRYGKLVYAETGADEAEAMFLLSEDGNRPQKYSDVPDDTSPTLFVTEDGPVLRRLVTDAEHEELSSLIDEPRAETTGFTGSDINGFYLDVRASNSEKKPIETTSDEGEYRRYHIQLDQTSAASDGRRDSSESTPAAPSLPSIPDEAVEECAPSCTSCVASIGGCSRCVLVCSGSPTGVGAVLCAVCIQMTCGLSGGVSCASCAGCILSYVPGCC